MPSDQPENQTSSSDNGNDGTPIRSNDNEEKKKPDLSKWTLLQILQALTVGQVVKVITTLCSMIAVSFTLGYKAANFVHDATPPPKPTPCPTQTPTVSPTPLPKVKVTFVDSEERKYDVNDEETNAHYFTKSVEHNSQLKALIEPRPISATKSLTMSDVENGSPELVVIHRSVFLRKFENDPEDKQLTKFLNETKNTNLIFLIYSRRTDTDAGFEAKIANATRLTGRIHTFQFAGKYPLSSPGQVDAFLTQIVLLASSKRAQDGCRN